MEIIPISSSNSRSTLGRLPTEYQMLVSRYPTDSSSNPWFRIQLNVEQVRTNMIGNIELTNKFDSEELELGYSFTADQIKFEIRNLLHNFRITDVDYVEGISERLSIDAAAQLRETERQAVVVKIIDFVRISRRLEIVRYVPGEDEVCCAICMDGVIEEDEVIKIPCSHVLHSHCLLRWLRVNNSCPLCRRFV